MLSLMSTLATSILMSAATLTNPTTPKALPFDASAYVTLNHQIRVSVDKTAEVPVEVLLRNADNQVVFRQSISKKDATYRVLLNVNELADGEYKLEVVSKEGSIQKALTMSTHPASQISRVVAMP